VLQALEKLHEHKFSLQALDCADILIDKEFNVRMKPRNIVRLGLSATPLTNSILESEDFRTLAPELLMQQDQKMVKRTLSSDVWSVGCVLFALLSGYQPFEENSCSATLIRIFKTMGTPTFSDIPSFADTQMAQKITLFPQFAPLNLC
jgi:serine/threonine protein kinase